MSTDTDEKSSDVHFAVPQLPISKKIPSKAPTLPSPESDSLTTPPTDEKLEKQTDNTDSLKNQIPNLLTDKLPEEGEFYIEEMKNGMVLKKIDLTTSRIVFGRAKGSVDIILEHPSISRFHAALLWSPGQIEGE